MKKVNRVNQIKSQKPFFKTDFIIYFGVLLFALAVFLLTFVFKGNDKVDKIFIIQNERTIFEYSFSQDEFSFDLEKESQIEILTNDDKLLKLNVYFDQEKKQFNQVLFDKVENSACVFEANCSASKDCVHFSPVKTNGDVIYCMPHKLKILAGSQNHDKLIVG